MIYLNLSCKIVRILIRRKVVADGHDITSLDNRSVGVHPLGRRILRLSPGFPSQFPFSSSDEAGTTMVNAPLRNGTVATVFSG